MLFWEDTFMGKRLISLILAVAVIAGFATVCSGAAYTTSEIAGKYKDHEETCTYNGVANADIAVIGAEVFKNNKSLAGKTQTFKNGAVIYFQYVSVRKSSANHGYHVGYYKVGNTMYYNRGYDYES